jgi:hypothetical protein
MTITLYFIGTLQIYNMTITLYFIGTLQIYYMTITLYAAYNSDIFLPSENPHHINNGILQ